MAVFECTNCRRLLYRPDDMLGRAWQCPNCGPIVVSEEEVSVFAGLAALLEEEYRLGLSAPLPGVEVTPRASGAVPPVPVNPRFVRGRDWLALSWLALLAVLTLGLIFLPEPYLDYVQASFLPFVVGTVLFAIVVIPILVFREFSHRQNMEAVESHLRRAPVPAIPARANPSEATDVPTPAPNQAIRGELSPTDVRQGDPEP